MAPTSPEAPVTAPESAPAGDFVVDVSQSHQRWDIPAKTETAPEAPSTSIDAAAPATSTPAPKAPEATGEQPPAPAKGKWDDLSEEDIEELSRHEKVRARAGRLADNEVGNREQRAREEGARVERERIAAENREFEEGTEFFNKLRDDDAFRAQQVSQHGEAEVLDFEARYIRHAEQRQRPQTAPAVNADQVRQEFATEFRNGAVNEFKEIAKAALPWADLPTDVKAGIEALRFDPNGNFLADGLRLVMGHFDAREKTAERKHAEAIEQAREAGRNEAIAGRAESAPVIVGGQPGADPHEVIKRFSEGDPNTTRADYHKAMTALGKSY